MRRTTWLAAGALLLAAQPAAAQSLFGTAGLGVPVAPVDARAQALGGVGVGLLGMNASLVNPAEPAGILRRGLSATFRSAAHDVEFGGARDRLGGTIFPLARVLYPVSERTVFSLGYGGFLDQSWAVLAEGTTPVGDDAVAVRDVTRSAGGIVQVRAGVARLLTPALAIGLAGGVYTGGLERTVTRQFPDRPDLRPVSTRTEWGYSAPLASVGLRWDPVPVARLGAAVTWSGTLQAERHAGTGEDRSFQLPLQVAVGASGVLAPRLLAAFGGRWAGWSAADDDGPASPGGIGRLDTADSWELGGGVEWQGARTAQRQFPVRLGARYGQLPFLLQGSAPREWAATLGAAAHFAVEETGPLAAAELAVERGGRGDAGATGLSESFWRLHLSLSLFGR
jgi:hypothetical protein